uniref:Uncharacterized protein n=1 Tax=Anopheles minimus TaxID=112268 RepID=A0A182W204_9DIPT
MTPELCLVEAHFVQLYEPIRSYTEPDPHNRSVVVAMSIGAFGNVEHGLLAGKLRNVVLLGLISKLTIRFADHRKLARDRLRVPSHVLRTTSTRDNGTSRETIDEPQLDLTKHLYDRFDQLVAFGNRLIPVGSKIALKYNERLFNISYNFLRPNSVGNQSLGFNIEIKQKLKDVKFLLLFHGLTRNGSVSSVLLKRQVDMCSFLRNRNSDRLLKSIYDYLTVRSHMPEQCPCSPGHYYMCNLKLDDAPVPAFLPETDFILEFIYFSGARTQQLVEFRLYGKLVRVIQNILFQGITI